MKTLSFSFYWSPKLERAIIERAEAPFTMSLTGAGEIVAVSNAVNQGIDSRLEACYVPARGDSFTHGERSIVAMESGPNWKAGDRLISARTLDCAVSPESLPVLIRRLLESGTGEGEMLASSICVALGIELI